MQLGTGKPEPDALVFCKNDGTPLDADYIARRWRRAIAKIDGFPKATLHWLRHTHFSALITAGRDPVEVSRRLGHSSPVVTCRSMRTRSATSQTPPQPKLSRSFAGNAGANRVPIGCQ